MSKPSALIWSGRMFTGLAILFWVMDGAIKLPPIKPVIDNLHGLGFGITDALARGLGLLQLACLALYVIPRTSLLGAILLTGYLGGAIAIQIRADNPLFTHILFGCYVGIITWVGLLLRDRQARIALFGAQTRSDG